MVNIDNNKDERKVSDNRKETHPLNSKHTKTLCLEMGREVLMLCFPKNKLAPCGHQSEISLHIHCILLFSQAALDLRRKSGVE